MVKEMDIPNHKHLGEVVIGRHTTFDKYGDATTEEFQGRVISLTFWKGGFIFQLRDQMPCIKVDIEDDEFEIRIVQ